MSAVDCAVVTPPSDRDEVLSSIAALDMDAALLARLLDQLEVGFCAYDAADRVQHWNESYLRFFPEQSATIRVGTTYAQTLFRFFESNLPENDLGQIERHVAAGVARHRSQERPFVFQRKSGRWLKVASQQRADGGRFRLWRDVTSEHSAEGHPGAAGAVAALDVGYAVFDHAGNFVSANKRYQELFPDIGDLTRPGVAYALHVERIASHSVTPADVEILRTIGRRSVPQATPFAGPTMLRRIDGGWLQLEERRGEDGNFIMLWADATRQAEAEARIVRLERYLHDAVEAIPSGLLLFDREERLVLANRRLIGIDVRLAATMVLDAPLSEFAEWLAAQEASGDPALELDRLRDGVAPQDVVFRIGPRFLELRALRTSSGDLLCLIADVTRERTAEAELQKQREAMHQTEKLTALGSLLAGVAHELNNPLSIVVGRASLLLETVVDQRIVAQVRSISAAAERCAKIVKTFLELARQRPPARRAVDVNAVVKDALNLLGYGLKSGGIEVELRLAPDLPPIWADPDQLSQVLINLLVNAQHALIERTEDRKLIIETAFDRPGERLRIAVADNGPGVPTAVRRRLFEPFFTTKPVGSGTGLGLSMSLGLIRAHDGQLTFTETPGGGATFMVELPVTGMPIEATHRLDNANSVVVSRTVMVVDDEPEIAQLVADVLELEGHRVILARDGAEALRTMATWRFDLVISDLMMPGLDGQGLWNEAGAAGRCRPPFIFITGDSLRNRRDSFLERTGCPLVHKPFTPDELRTIVQKSLPQ